MLGATERPLAAIRLVYASPLRRSLISARSDFLHHQLVAELSTAGGPLSPGTIRAVGHRLQARFLGAAPIVASEDRD